MTKKTKTLNHAGVALAIGLSGCGVERAATKTLEPATTPPVTEQPAAVPSTRAELQRSVQESLAHLNALQLFTADSLVLKLPANARDCYGVPCPGDAQGQAAYDTELARQAKRLAALTAQAEACNSGHCYLFSPESGRQALDALNALEVVHVSALVVAAPKNNPSCYNLPCPADIEAARVENRRREVMAFTIASYTNFTKDE